MALADPTGTPRGRRSLRTTKRACKFCHACPIIDNCSKTATRAWRNGRRSGLEKNLSARRETGDAELLKVGETSLTYVAIPSQARREISREGVETRRAAPKPRDRPGEGEGIVQTANRTRKLQENAPSGRRKP
jgi:hypothetical protein